MTGHTSPLLPHHSPTPPTDKLGGTQPSKQSLLYFLGNLPPAYWQKSQAITFKVYTFWLTKLIVILYLHFTILSLEAGPSVSAPLPGSLSLLLHWNVTRQCLSWDFMQPPHWNSSRWRSLCYFMMKPIKRRPDTEWLWTLNSLIPEDGFHSAILRHHQLGWEALFQRFNKETWQ